MTVPWRYEVNHGPDGETEYAWVFDGNDNRVCNIETLHAITIVRVVNAHDALVEALESFLDGEDELIATTRAREALTLAKGTESDT